MSTDEYLKIIVDTGEQILSREELMRGVGPPYRKERGAWTAVMTNICSACLRRFNIGVRVWVKFTFKFLHNITTQVVDFFEDINLRVQMFDKTHMRQNLVSGNVLLYQTIVRFDNSV